MSNTITSMLIDTREPEPLRAALNKHFEHVIARSEMALDCGDLWLTTSDNAMIVIERKTVPDLLQSIKDGRLTSQASKMRQKSQWCYIVVTGQFTQSDSGAVSYSHNGQWVETGWNYDSVQGALVTAQELGAIVVFSATYIQAIERIVNRSRSAVKIVPARESVVFGGGELVLSALPNIGSTKALELMSEFGNAAVALDFLTDVSWQDGTVKGIGDKTKQNIRDILGLKDGQYLGLKDMGEKINE